jgi:hypothetical protein
MRFSFIFLLVSFQGCVGLTPQQQAQDLKAEVDRIQRTFSRPCSNIGRKVDTDAHVQCMLALDKSQRRSEKQISSTISNAGNRLIGLIPFTKKPIHPTYIPSYISSYIYSCDSVEYPEGFKINCKLID